MQDPPTPSSYSTLLPHPNQPPKSVVRRSFSGMGEPSMADVLSDSIIRQVMARDGVGTEQLTLLIDQVRAQLA